MPRFLSVGRVFADQRCLWSLCRLFSEAVSQFTIMMGILLVRWVLVEGRCSRMLILVSRLRRA